MKQVSGNSATPKDLEQQQFKRINDLFQSEYGITFTPEELPEVKLSLFYLGRAIFRYYTNTDKEACEEI
jgi:hypothetical protein